MTSPAATKTTAAETLRAIHRPVIREQAKAIFPGAGIFVKPAHPSRNALMRLPLKLNDIPGPSRHCIMRCSAGFPLNEIRGVKTHSTSAASRRVFILSHSAGSKATPKWRSGEVQPSGIVPPSMHIFWRKMRNHMMSKKLMSNRPLVSRPISQPVC